MPGVGGLVVAVSAQTGQRVPQQRGDAGAGGLHQVFGLVQHWLTGDPRPANLRHGEQQDAAHAVGQA